MGRRGGVTPNIEIATLLSKMARVAHYVFFVLYLFKLARYACR
jgi:hypothetical protein